MTPKPFTNTLITLKAETKRLLLKGLKPTLALLETLILPSSPAFDHLIIIYSQFQHYEDELLHDILNSEERRLGHNRIQDALLKLVNGLKEEDLNMDL